MVNSCSGLGHYLGPASIRDPASIKDLPFWPPASIRAAASIRTYTVCCYLPSHLVFALLHWHQLSHSCGLLLLSVKQSTEPFHYCNTITHLVPNFFRVSNPIVGVSMVPVYTWSWPVMFTFAVQIWSGNPECIHSQKRDIVPTELNHRYSNLRNWDWNHYYGVLCSIMTTRISRMKNHMTSFPVWWCFQEAKKVSCELTFAVKRQDTFLRHTGTDR